MRRGRENEVFLLAVVCDRQTSQRRACRNTAINGEGCMTCANFFPVLCEGGKRTKLCQAKRSRRRASRLTASLFRYFRNMLLLLYKEDGAVQEYDYSTEVAIYDISTSLSLPSLPE